MMSKPAVQSRWMGLFVGVVPSDVMAALDGCGCYYISRPCVNMQTVKKGGRFSSFLAVSSKSLLSFKFQQPAVEPSHH